MKRKFTVILLVLALVVMLAAATWGYNKLSENNAPEAPQHSLAADAELADDFTVLDYEGNEVSLSDFFGKPIVVNFWATWCGPCKLELPHFDSLSAEYGDSVQFMMVNLTDGGRDTVEGVKNYVSEKEYSFPVFFDTEFSAAIAYGIQSVPRTIFINADGTFAGSHLGMMDKETLREYIEAIIE